jgi:hypothetical protein
LLPISHPLRHAREPETKGLEPEYHLNSFGFLGMFIENMTGRGFVMKKSLVFAIFTLANIGSTAFGSTTSAETQELKMQIVDLGPIRKPRRVATRSTQMRCGEEPRNSEPSFPTAA